MIDSPKVKLEFWTDGGKEKVGLEIPGIDNGPWGFFEPGTEEETYKMIAKLVGSYFNDRQKDHAWLEMAINIALQRSVQKGIIVRSIHAK